MQSLFIRAVCVTPVLLGGLAHATGTWEVQQAPLDPYNVTVGGVEREIAPSCQLQLDPTTGWEQLEPYSFYFKNGKNDKLVIYFNGGGACWDKTTCVDSLAALPTWVPTVLVANNPEEMGGILRLDDSNPYADWSMLFVSYCTGDIHAGSNVRFYEGVPIPIYHRGFDNFVSAMDWLKTEHPEIDPDKILVSGSSAGAYGAGLNYLWIRDFYPDADKIFLVGDAGFGVFGDYDSQKTEAFASAAFGQDSVWGMQVHPELADALQPIADDPEELIPAIYSYLATAYPKEKFAQYTTAYDAAQIAFWSIMLNPGDPDVWVPGLFELIEEWNRRMNSTDAWLQSYTPENYRSYVDSGCVHTILRDDAFYEYKLTSSSSGEPIRFLDWLLAMTGEKTAEKGRPDKADWENLNCNDSSCGDTFSFDWYACLSQALPTPPTP